jgi:hypothetical protein
MDMQSVISNDGLEIMANPETHLTESQLVRIKNEKAKLAERRKDKGNRRQIQEQRSLARQEAVSSIGRDFDDDEEVNDITESFEKKLNISPLLHIKTPVITPYCSPRQSPNDFVEVSRQMDQLRRDIGNVPEEEPSPKMEPSKLSPDQIQKLVELSVVRALKKHGPPASPASSGGNGHSAAYDNFLEDDVVSRLKSMKNKGVDYSQDFDLETADKRRKEMEHWRMKLTLEEKELEQNCSTFIAVGADLLEGLCDAIDFHTFETKHLSAEMEDAIKSGRFNSCVKQYANMGGGQFMKNPLMNFLTTFSSIALKNHLNQKKSKALNGSKTNKRSAKKPDKKDADEYESPEDSDMSDRKRRRRHKRQSRSSSDEERSAHYHQPPPSHYYPPYYPPYPYHSPHPYGAPQTNTNVPVPPVAYQMGPPPQHYSTPHQQPTPPQQNYQAPYQQQYPPHDYQTPQQAPPEQKHQRQASALPPQQSTAPYPHVGHNHKKEIPLKTTRPMIDETEQKINDVKTGKQRVLMSETSSSLSLDQISGTLNKFNPVMKHVKTSMKNQKELETEKKAIKENAPVPVSLF